MFLQREALVQAVLSRLRHAPVVALLGPRQVGKTSLARAVAGAWEGGVTTFDLEQPSALARLAEPELALGPLRGLVILDEVQRRPELFPVLRSLADRPRRPARFLVLGSASAELLRQESESLAGRVSFVDVRGFSLAEVGARRLDRLWLRGGFPRSFVAGSDGESFTWRSDFITTFVERDLAALGPRLPSASLRRLWAMLSHVHGGVLHWSELGRALGVADPTVRRHAELLEGALVLDLLHPWHENIAKRQVKAPKVYVRDSGLLHALLGLRTRAELLDSPRSGASWEGFCLDQVRRVLGVGAREAYFWATHQGAELDLLVLRGRSRFGFEFKRTAAPSVTASMRQALATLRLDALVVVHGGAESFALGERLHAVAAARLLEDVPALVG